MEYSRGFVMIALLAVISFVGCGGGSGTTPAPTPTTTGTFPNNLAVTSPTEFTSASSQVLSSLAKATSAYSSEASKISAVFSATSLADCGVNFGKLLTPAVNAECYGPQVTYANHPDATGGVSPNGTLPTGDLGLWSLTDSTTNNACGAAELNSRMDGIKDQTTTVLKTLASIICTISNTTGLSLPSAGASVTLTTEYNEMLAAAGVTTATASAVTLSATSNVSGTVDYGYTITLSLTSPLATTLKINMTHRALDSANTTYTGKFDYYFNNTDDMGNCHQEYSTSDITEIGSVVYEKASATTLAFDSRYTQTCGHDNTAPLVSGLLDPTKGVTDAAGTNGWVANFTKFVSNFEPATNAGNFAFMWQASPSGGAARTFNMHLGDSDSDNLLDGVFFFGYGDDISTSDGSIKGIFCNWAGPGGATGGTDLSKRQTLCQRQGLQQETSGNFSSVSGSTFITYAPENSCSSTVAQNFTFYSTNQTMTNDHVDGSVAVTSNLIAPSDATNGIAVSGFTMPTAPVGP